jgi:hypothetical protein
LLSPEPAAVTAVAFEASAATARSAAATATPATAGISAILGGIHSDLSPIQGCPVHRRDRRFAVGRIGKRDESESARPSGLAIGDDLRIRNRSKLLECTLETRIIGVPAETTYKEFL